MKFHNKYVLRNNNLCVAQKWGWKGCYIFLDLEDNKTHIIRDISKYNVLGEEEGRKIFNERNYTKPKNGEILDKRQLRYGKIHDNLLNINEVGTNGTYTNRYTRGVAFLISQYYFLKDLKKKYGENYKVSLDKMAKDEKFKNEMVNKYMFGNDSMYIEYCRKMDNNEVTEDEVMAYLIKLDKLPQSYKESIYKTILMKSPEMQYLIKKNRNKKINRILNESN